MKRIALLALVVVIAAIGAGWGMKYRVHVPYRGFSETEVFVLLPSGSSVSSIARRLADAGVVPDALTFRAASRLAKLDRHLLAGEYRFDGPSSPAEVALRISRGDVYTRTVTFPEGLTIVEMAAIFERSGIGTAEEFVQAAANPALVSARDPDAASLEGFLFPSTYSLPRTAGATGMVAAMVAQFDKAMDADLRAAAAARRMTVHDVVTLASIIEKESSRLDEVPLVSAVYHNRLRLGMALQCDPTVIYALMLEKRWSGNLRRVDLQMPSPYNTYRHAGLPPGPIASPGRAALEAAVRPAAVNYLYFVSRNDGTHAFASSYAEHSRNVAKWQVRYFRNLKAGTGNR